MPDVKGKTYPFVLRNGDKVTVLRPDNPKLAVAIAMVAVEKQDRELFNRIPHEVKDYQFMGYLAMHPDGLIIDENGLEVGRCEAGDSFAQLKDVEKMKAESDLG